MIGHHVAQRAGGLIKVAALLDTYRLRSGDLDMIDAVAIPDRFEQSIGEAKGHDVLDRILSKKMIDPEDLVLVQGTPGYGR